MAIPPGKGLRCFPEEPATTGYVKSFMHTPQLYPYRQDGQASINATPRRARRGEQGPFFAELESGWRCALSGKLQGKREQHNDAAADDVVPEEPHLRGEEEYHDGRLCHDCSNEHW